VSYLFSSSTSEDIDRIIKIRSFDLPPAIGKLAPGFQLISAEGISNWNAL